ncbi:hypothetical protein D027_3980A, partial [Vibrio parahaemolyticus 861]
MRLPDRLAGQRHV